MAKETSKGLPLCIRITSQPLTFPPEWFKQSNFVWETVSFCKERKQIREMANNIKKKKPLCTKKMKMEGGEKEKKKNNSNTSVKYLLILIPYLTKDSLKNAWNKSKFVSL